MKFYIDLNTETYWCIYQMYNIFIVDMYSYCGLQWNHNIDK